MKTHLLVSCEINVLKEIIALGWDKESYTGLVEKMKLRYISIVDQNTQTHKLIRIKKHAGISYAEYASEIMQLASTSLNRQLEDSLLVALFINGLENEDLRAHINK